jgi:hypothetical protein
MLWCLPLLSQSKISMRMGRCTSPLHRLDIGILAAAQIGFKELSILVLFHTTV